MNPALKKNRTYDLSATEFVGGATEYSFEEALARGRIIDVTCWVVSEMGFAGPNIRVHVAITARLWNRMLQIATRMSRFQTVVGRRNDVLWLAAYAMEQAKKFGREAATFDALLPTDDGDDAAIERLRVAKNQTRSDRTVVTIGFVDET